MKKYIYIIISFIWIIGCTTDVPLEKSSEDNQEITLSFKINIPEAEINRTKGKDEATIPQSLNLLVFDQNGLFLSRYTATLNGSTYSVRIITSSQPRIIHFVSNYDFSTFSDVANLYTSETTLIPSLTLKDQVAYWHREMLNN
ncbi:MAG: hypothetical protein ACRCX5_06780, partial [Bacteroidales bacterium]